MAKAIALLLLFSVWLLPADSHAQFFLNDVIGGANNRIGSMNYNLRTYNNEVAKLKKDYSEHASNATETQKRKWLRKMKRLHDEHAAMSSAITRINDGSEAINKMQKAIVDDAVQIINDEAQQKADQQIDKATGKVKAHPYYGKVAPKAKGILKDVKIANGELKKLACPGPIVASSLSTAFADMVGVPKIFFKIMCLPPVSFNLMKKITQRTTEKILSPLCINADALAMLPDLPHLPNLPQLKLNPLKNLDIPMLPKLPGFPNVNFTDFGMLKYIPLLPSIPKIPMLKPVAYKLPQFPVPPQFGWSVHLGCTTVNGQAGPADFTPSGNQDELNETLQELKNSGEWTTSK